MAKTFLDKNNKKLFEVYETKEIVANPVLSGGEANLTSFQVGETKYKIEGGGGGTEYTAGYGINITNDEISIEPSEVAQKFIVTDIKLLDDEDCFALNPGDIVLEEETISSENPIQAKQYTPYTVSYKFTGSGNDSYTFAELALTNAEAQQIKTVIYNYDGTQPVGSQWYYTETIVTTLNTNDITSLSNDQCDSLKIGDKVLERTATEDDVVNTLYSVSNYTEDEYLNLKTLELVSVNKSQISTVTYQKNIAPSRGINDWVYIGTQVFSVSANPVSTTETLNSIEINGTNYAIAGGGTTYTAGTGINIANDEISVSSNVVLRDTNQTISGRKYFTNSNGLQSCSTSSSANKVYINGYVDNPYFYLQSSHDACLRFGLDNSNYYRPTGGANKDFVFSVKDSTNGGTSYTYTLKGSPSYPHQDKSFIIATTEDVATYYTAGTNITINNGVISASGGTEVTGTNDGTNWTSLTINNDTYAIPQGGGSSGMDITAQEIEEYFDEYCDIQAEVTEETIEGEDVNVLNLENVELENGTEYLGLDLNASNVSVANKILDIE